MSEEWGPWIEHDGGGVPAHVIGHWLLAEAEYHNGGTFRQEGCIYGNELADPVYGAWVWPNFGTRIPGTTQRYARVLRYRIRKPRGMTILENLIADLPAPSLNPSPINETAPREELPV